MDIVVLENYVKQGLSVREIAKLRGKSYSSTRHWLNKFNIKTIHSNGPKNYSCECGESRQTEFYGKKKSRCKKCIIKDDANRAVVKKKKAIEYKGGKCLHCGYGKFYGALEFHHNDPMEKEFDWGEVRNKKWPEIEKELNKCTLLCSNCHKEEHHRLRIDESVIQR